MTDNQPDEFGGNSKQQLAGFVERVESLLDEKAQVSEKIKAEYAEAAAAGFDKKALKQLLKERQADTVGTVEHRSIVALYRRALGTLTGTPLGDWARGWMSREAKMRLDDAKATYADPRLDEFMKGRQQRGVEGEGKTT